MNMTAEEDKSLARVMALEEKHTLHRERSLKIDGHHLTLMEDVDRLEDVLETVVMVLLQNVLPTKCPSTKRPSTKHPWIQNVLLYKKSFHKTSTDTKRPCLQNVLPQNVLPL